jgi:hypothetical protein
LSCRSAIADYCGVEQRVAPGPSDEHLLDQRDQYLDSYLGEGSPGAGAAADFGAPPISVPKRVIKFLMFLNRREATRATARVRREKPRVEPLEVADRDRLGRRVWLRVEVVRGGGRGRA